MQANYTLGSAQKLIPYPFLSSFTRKSHCDPCTLLQRTRPIHLGGEPQPTRQPTICPGSESKHCKALAQRKLAVLDPREKRPFALGGRTSRRFSYQCPYSTVFTTDIESATFPWLWLYNFITPTDPLLGVWSHFDGVWSESVNISLDIEKINLKNV